MHLRSVSPAPENPAELVLERSHVVSYRETARRSFQRDTKELVELLSARVQKNREALDEYILLGRLFRMRGEPRRALRLHRNLLTRPALSRELERVLHAEIGFDCLDAQVGDFGESHFKKAIERKRQDVSALEGLAQAHEMQGNTEAAAEILNKLVRLGRPERQHLAFVFSALALEHLSAGSVSRARRAVNRALKNDPDNLFAHLTLADVFVGAERFERAIETLKEILKRWPSHSFLALRRMEDAHYRMNAFTAYEHTLRECIRASPDNFYLHYSLARHLRKKRRNSDAFESLRRAYELNPLYVNTVRDRIELLGEQSRAPEVALLAREFLSSFKRHRRFICPNCRHRFIPVTWHCTQCGMWATFDIRYELPAP